MLNLDILHMKFASISPLHLELAPETPEDNLQSICAFYTEALDPGEGQASYVITDEFLFCGKIIQRETSAILLVGPAAEYPLSAEIKKRITDDMGLHRNQALSLQETLSTLPIMQLSQFLQQLSFLNYVINENENIQRNSIVPAEIPGSGRQMSIADTHNTQELENQMFACIEFGKLELMQSLLEAATKYPYTTGIMSTDSLRAYKKTFVTSTSLSSRAAVKGGLDYGLAMQISDDYLQQIELIQTFEEFYQLWTKMLLDYTTRTANLRLPHDASPLIRSVIQQINGQLHQKISVEQLACSQNVNRSYLSHQFKRETGKNLTDYIAEQKIDEAVRLMETTNMTLAEISFHLAFSSQSYFHATFKKIKGINPGKYPRRIHDTLSK